MKRHNDLVMIMAAGTRSKVVVITGVGRGLGRAMAIKFAELGHQVAGCSRDELMVNALDNELAGSAHLTALDVADDPSVKRWVGKVLGELGIPGLLINNAAVINPSRKLWELTAKEFDPVVDVNLKGVANTIRYFAEPMIAQGEGVIVNFSSGWGRSTSPEVAPYCASKWGIEGLTQALAQELPSGMAAVPLNPGIINTDMLRSCFGASATDFPSATEWAEMAVPFLLNLGPEDNGRSLSVS